MSRAVVVQVFVLIWLAVVWVWLWGDISWANVAGGFAVGALIMTLLPLPRVPTEGKIYPLSLLKLAGYATYCALESSVQVSWLALRPARPPATGVLRIHLSIRSDLVLVLCTDLLNLIPGTMVIELDKDRRLAYVHVLDAGSDAAVQKFYRTTHRIESLFIESFEREPKGEPEVTT